MNTLRTVILVRSTGIQPIINYAIYYQLDPQTTSEDDTSLMYLLPTTAIAGRGIYPARNDKLLVGLVNPNQHNFDSIKVQKKVLVINKNNR